MPGLPAPRCATASSTTAKMRSRANARRLLDSMERLEQGRGTTHELIDD